MSKCDLHIHSRYSARTEEWLFRRFDFPDSYSDPKKLNKKLRKRGMDYVTITDHDSIDGCLEIAHLPRTFISEQVTTYFPRMPASCTFWCGESLNSSTATSKASATTFLICSGPAAWTNRPRGSAPAIQRQRETRGNAPRAAHSVVQTF